MREITPLSKKSATALTFLQIFVDILDNILTNPEDIALEIHTPTCHYQPNHPKLCTY